MEPEQFQFLLSGQGQKILSEMRMSPITPHNHLQVAARLRQQIDPAYAQAIMEIAVLRQRASGKFSQAQHMYFTRSALEQASAEIVAVHRAKRFFAAGFNQVADIGCSIGGDALALAANAEVFGIDKNYLRLLMAVENTRVYGTANRFHPIQADLTDFPPLPVQSMFFDPARRDARGKRLHSVHLYQPPLSLIDLWREKTPHAAVKISPGVDYAELSSDAEIEFVSLDGEVKEGVLWYGEFRQGIERRATLLPSGETLCSADYPGPDVEIAEPAAYLYEPDGAIIRAHLIQPLARHLGATQIDRDIAYLTADYRLQTPFARCYRLLDWFPFQLKRLRQYLQADQVGQVTIKKRGSPLEPDWLKNQLRLRGHEQRVLFLTHVRGQPAVLIGLED